MKQIFLLILAFTVTCRSYSQSADSVIVLKSPATRLSGLIDIQDLVNQGYNFWEDEFKGHWAGIELGINGFANPDYSMYPVNENNFLQNTPLLSNTLNLNLLQYSMGLQQIRTTIGLVTGLGISFKGYHIADNTSITLDENRKVQPEYVYLSTVQKSKFAMIELEIPLLIEFQIPIRNYANRLYFSTGLTGSKRLETHSKIKYEKDGKKEKLKSPGNYSVREYKVAATFRVGYRRVNLFASYDLATLFENKKGPVLYPYSVGIRLISF
jgi:hypothetical protein